MVAAASNTVSAIRERDFEAFPRNLMHIMSMISMNPDDPAQVVGSFRFSKQEYPSDIDMSNIFHVHQKKNDALDEMVKAFQDIAWRIQNDPNIHFSDFKCGEDKRYNIYIGKYTLQKGVLRLINYNPTRIRTAIDSLSEKGLITNREHTEWISLVMDRPNYVQHDALHQAIRKRLVLRWSIPEILKGVKKLPQNTSIRLQDAIMHKTVTKIDVYAFVMDRLMEITNFFVLYYTDNRGTHLLADMTWILPKLMDENLEKEIVILSNYGQKHMKLLKRIWLKARNRMNMPLLKKLQNFFDTGTSKLYQVQVDVHTMMDIMDKVDPPPLELMDGILQNHKFRLSSIKNQVLPHEDKLRLFNLINRIKPSNINKQKLDTIYHFIHRILDPKAASYVEHLKRVGFV